MSHALHPERRKAWDPSSTTRQPTLTRAELQELPREELIEQLAGLPDTERDAMIGAMFSPLLRMGVKAEIKTKLTEAEAAGGKTPQARTRSKSRHAHAILKRHDQGTHREEPPTAASAPTMASASEEPALGEIRALFDSMDRNKDESVNRIEMIQALRKDPTLRGYFGLKEASFKPGSPEHTRFESLFQSMDADNSKEISWEEFLKVAQHSSDEERVPAKKTAGQVAWQMLRSQMLPRDLQQKGLPLPPPLTIPEPPKKRQTAEDQYAPPSQALFATAPGYRKASHREPPQPPSRRSDYVPDDIKALEAPRCKPHWEVGVGQVKSELPEVSQALSESTARLREALGAADSHPGLGLDSSSDGGCITEMLAPPRDENRALNRVGKTKEEEKQVALGGFSLAPWFPLFFCLCLTLAPAVTSL